MLPGPRYGPKLKTPSSSPFRTPGFVSYLHSIRQPLRDRYEERYGEFSEELFIFLRLPQPERHMLRLHGRPNHAYQLIVKSI